MWTTDLNLLVPRMSFCATAEQDFTQLIFRPLVVADAGLRGATFTLGGALNVCHGCSAGP